MYIYGPMMDGNDWGFGVLMMVLWLLLIVAIIVLVMRLLGGHGNGTIHKADPLDIAKERYAKGELTKEQFEQVKKDLS